MGSGANSTVHALALQIDGKILIGGSFTSYNGTTQNRIARLNADGSFDPTFTGGANSQVYTIALQPDGKILIGGGFFNYNLTSRNSIARLNADGSLDLTFNPGTGANSDVQTIALQTDGKILIGGSFTSYNGTTRNYIARLNADGTLDLTFNPGTGANDFVQTIALQPDGKILMGGGFTSYNGTTQNYITRLNVDGTIDLTFNLGTGANSAVLDIALQPDGNILIGGGFTAYNGIGRNRVARIMGDPIAPACPNPIVTQTNVVKAPFCAGSLATVKVGYSGGSGPKSILWSNGATTKFTTVPAGTYTVTVSDAQCSKTDTVVVTDPANSDMSVTGVVVTKSGAQIFNVSWAAPAPVAGKTIIGYRVAYRLRGTTTFNQLPLTTNLTAAVNFTGLGLCNGNYDFTVYTRFDEGGLQKTSAPACFVSKGYSGGVCKTDGDEPAEDVLVSSFDFTVYPNPTQGLVYVEAPAGTTLEVYDLRGIKLLEAHTQNGSHTLDLSSYAKGVYLLRLQSGDRVETQRIMRE